jgi:hypothetical protein
MFSGRISVLHDHITVGTYRAWQQVDTSLRALAVRMIWKALENSVRAEDGSIFGGRAVVVFSSSSPL